jgi:hypothetical protein|tara:strand:- start:10330 stop:10578 length:249 start_codon:yes stop_codon:yes gene_type:complete
MNGFDMEFCTNRYAQPKDDVLDWCVNATPDSTFFVQLFLELIVLFFLFIVMNSIFSKYKRWRAARKALNRGRNNKSVWPPEN